MVITIKVRVLKEQRPEPPRELPQEVPRGEAAEPGASVRHSRRPGRRSPQRHHLAAASGSSAAAQRQADTTGPRTGPRSRPRRSSVDQVLRGTQAGRAGVQPPLRHCLLLHARDVPLRRAPSLELRPHAPIILGYHTQQRDHRAARGETLMKTGQNREGPTEPPRSTPPKQPG